MKTKQQIDGKCVLREDGYFDFCNGIKHVMNEIAGSRQIGLSQVNLTNLTTRKVRCIGVQFRKTLKDKPMLLNYCPFCGERIDNFNDLKPQ